jgi:UDP-2,3-diacylglucosamine hydrolase
VLHILTFDFKDNYVVKAILKNQQTKSICFKRDNFLDIRLSLIKKQISLMDIDGIIEGHFHQNVEFNTDGIYYKNLGAFACDKSFFQVQSYEIFKLSEIKIGEAIGER